MSERILLIAAFASLLAGCSTLPEQSADVDSYSPKIYRTGSNIPTKDYGAEDVRVASPELLNPANRSPLNCRSNVVGC